MPRLLPSPKSFVKDISMLCHINDIFLYVFAELNFSFQISKYPAGLLQAKIADTLMKITQRIGVIFIKVFWENLGYLQRLN